MLFRSISEEKREAIKKAVEKTGYHPSIQAQTLRTKKTKMIGVILPRIDSYSISRIVEGILEIANKEGYRIFLANTENDYEKELEYLSVFDEKQVDGVILLGTIITEKHKKALKKSSVPVVVVGQKVEGVNSVYHDDYGAEYELTERLIKNGCKKLGYIGVTEKDMAVGYERHRAYKDAIACGKSVCHEDMHVYSDFDKDSGYEAMKELIEKYPDIDCVVAATDTIAVGAMQYLKEIGKRIPEDIKLAGQGDSVVGNVTSPAITSIRYYYKDSGKTACTMVISAINGNEAHVNEIKMGYKIIERDSTGGKRYE